MARNGWPGDHAHGARAGRLLGPDAAARPIHDQVNRRSGLRLGAALLAVFGAVVLSPFAARIARSRHQRIAVTGHSMEPALRDGDWLLVDPTAFVGRGPRPGELVVARDPRHPTRLIVKRVRDVSADGRLYVAGDHPAHGDEGAAIGAVPPDAIVGRPWLRYWPPRRVGTIWGGREGLIGCRT